MLRSNLTMSSHSDLDGQELNDRAADGILIVDFAVLAALVELQQHLRGGVFYALLACFSVFNTVSTFVWPTFRKRLPNALVIVFCYLVGLIPGTILKVMLQSVGSMGGGVIGFVFGTALTASLLARRLSSGRDAGTVVAKC